jgi:hypothetical protein
MARNEANQRSVVLIVGVIGSELQLQAVARMQLRRLKTAG